MKQQVYRFGARMQSRFQDRPACVSHAARLDAARFRAYHTRLSFIEIRRQRPYV
jgi:hypothetical protein